VILLDGSQRETAQLRSHRKRTLRGDFSTYVYERGPHWGGETSPENEPPLYGEDDLYPQVDLKVIPLPYLSGWGEERGADLHLTLRRGKKHI